jgi:ornithine carbamoyltransferase
MKQKHLVSLRDHTRAEIEEIFDLARRVKADPAAYADSLRGKSLAMIFQKASTRTRVSFEVGMYQLGGHALNLSASDIQLHRGETVADTARVLSRYVDGIMARVFSHEDLVEMSRHATVPVINGLSDLLHPVQALADFFTLLERRGSLDGLTLAYVGDGNNMCHALMIGAVKLGVAMRVAAPRGYEPNQLIVKSAQREAQRLKTAPPVVTGDPMEAVQGADAIYTDVWTSMGQEAESEARKEAFQGYIVGAEAMAAAAPEAVFMHCLPAHRGEEVAAEVIDGPQSVVFDQVENRLHVQKAILILLMGGSQPAGAPSTLRA